MASSTYFVENLNVSTQANLGGDIVFDNVTNDLTVTVTAQASGTATLTVPDLLGVNNLLPPLLPAGVADNEVIRMHGTTGIQSATNVKLLDTDVFTDVVGVTALAGGDLTITAAAGQDTILAVDAGQLVTVTGGGLTVAQDLLVSGDTILTGDLTVNGTTTSVNSVNVTIEDNNLILSSNYTTAVARQGGITVNYLPTAVSEAVIATGFTSTTVVEVADASVFSAGDIILVSDANTPGNNGLFQVTTGAGTTLTIIAPAGTQNYLQSAFAAIDTVVAGTVTVVTVAVLQAGTDGRFEVAEGSAVPLVFVDLALVSELPAGTWTEVDVNTTDATLTTAATVATTTDKSQVVEVVYTASEDSANDALAGKNIRSIFNTGGTATTMGLGSKDISSNLTGSTWAVTTAVSAANILIQVQGAAATTIDWRILYRITESP